MAPFVKTPQVTQPKTISMPDPEDPSLLAKKRQEMLSDLASGGRSSTVLSGGGAGGDYTSTTLGN